MLLIDVCSTNASAAEFISYRLKLYLAGRHHHHIKKAQVMQADQASINFGPDDIPVS